MIVFMFLLHLGIVVKKIEQNPVKSCYSLKVEKKFNYSTRVSTTVVSLACVDPFIDIYIFCIVRHAQTPSATLTQL